MKTDLKSLLRPAIQALQVYWPAILIIQGLALAVVCSYYWIEGSAALLDKVAYFKTEGGLLFAAVTTVVSGGILPELLKRRFRPAGSDNPTAGELLHQFTMWAIIGLIVDRFYWFQAQIFGNGNDPATLLLKVVCDQLLFTPAFVLPFIVSWFILYEHRSNLREGLRALTFTNIRTRILPIWATSLCFWPLMLLIVYSLPSKLQFPLFLFGNAAFSTLMIFIARRQSEEPGGGDR
ncbi:hypothetical protein [Puniceicoccus vermicola]|uniref:Uncharacterized protein n=1 Tax=Puniceicoccus vermicola TaxID=388746 RepID=A0A7X1AWR7_9BACT|nr:hypothetical protein [Puniceicoccus vermicola]MBC2601262.1 hypothetical protein [Puniceicoccus vermicola]